MKNLTYDRWLQIDTLFQKVLEQPAELRLPFLHGKCRADEELMQHVEKLLKLHREAEHILGDSADAFVAPLVPGLLKVTGENASEFEENGSRIGSYEIIEKLGRGGMGSVYLAKKKESPYDKKVAIKLLRKGMDTEDIIRRFRNEGRILASLEHPNIARLYDGGVHSDGRPYFVMEYIEGEPIDRYCDTHKLTIKERIKLFRTVCEAVHFAHQSLIVHRDIKPANVLVTSDRTIKLLDFGIAKLLEPGQADLTDFHTQTGIKVMTPEFASPEQVQVKPITTASDIYALGVLLYKLVTGRRPYRVRTTSLLEIERIICETAPLHPSEAVTGKPLPAPTNAAEDNFDASAAAQLRARDTGSLRKELTGDLDRIILKALRKEPERRYRSALGFSEDLDNYYQGKPVQARPSTIGYRARKFIQRNKWAVSVLTIALFSVLAGLGIALWQADVARTERDIAQSEAAKTLAVQNYLVDLFEAADPAENRGEEITVREIVDRGIAGLEEGFGGQPEVHIEMLKVLGRVEQALGDFNLSVELLEKALNKSRELYGDEHLNVASAAAMLGEVERWNGNFDSAESLLREALAIRQRLIREDHSDLAINKDRLARTLEMKGDFEEAELLYGEALEMRERLFGENSDAVSANLNNLGWLLYQMGKQVEAEQTLRRSLQIKNQIMEPPHPAIASNLSNLSVVLRARGYYREAEEFAIQALEQEIKLHGEDHPRVTTALNNRTLILLDLGRYKEAAQNYRLILENNRRQLRPDHLYVGFSLSGLARSLTEDGRSGEALPLYDEALEIYRNSVGEDHRYYGMSLALKGEALYYHNLQQAESVLEQSVDIISQAVGKNHPNFVKAMTSLGRTQYANGKSEAAESTLSEAVDIQRRILTEANANTVWTLISLGQILTDQERFEEAETVLKEAVEMASAALHQEHWRSIKARLELAICQIAMDRADGPREMIEKILAGLEGRTDFHAVLLQSRASVFRE